MASHHVVYCGHCGDEIEHCEGRYGEWKHTRTNAERCGQGLYATPQDPTAVEAARRPMRKAEPPKRSGPSRWG